MYIKLGNVTLHIGVAFAVIFAVGANFTDVRIYLISFLCALFHECVHLLALNFCGCKKAVLDFCPGGVKLTAEGFVGLSYNKTVFCTLSAPVVNIISGAVFYCLFLLTSHGILYEIAAVNFILGLINLLPLPFLDGGRALFAFLGKYLDEPVLRRVTFAVCVISLSVLFIVFFITFLSGKYYLFFLFFFIYSVLGVIGDKSRDVFT